MKQRKKQVPREYNDLNITEKHSHPISHEQARNDVKNDVLELLNSHFSNNSNAPTINDIAKLYKLKQIDGNSNVFSITQKNVPEKCSSRKRGKRKSEASLTNASSNVGKKLRPRLRSRSRSKTSSRSSSTNVHKKKKRSRSRSRSRSKPIKINGKLAIENSKKPKTKYNIKKLMKTPIPTTFEF